MPSRGQSRVGWGLASPAIAAGLVVSIYPLVYLVATSVTKSTLGKPFQEWVGLGNFMKVVADETFTDSLVRSVLVAVLGALFQTSLGLAIALALRALVRGVGAITTLILLPLLTPPVMAAVIWKLVLDPTGGVFNGILRGLGFTEEPISLLGSSTWAIVMIALADAWQWTPFVAILIYAALLTLPDEVYEAAKIDGAGPWRSFVNITLPLVMPALIGIFMIKLILSFKLFDAIYILTAGGPGDTTTLSGYLIFRTGLREFNVGAAAAMTLVFVLVVTIVTLPVMWASKKAKY
ncbi:MAG: transrane type protein [Actinomycetota bacterium]|jgi:multiple sugar transport system permease protein|nr:transrane type protein [Actinomycetota bacterium]